MADQGAKGVGIPYYEAPKGGVRLLDRARRRGQHCVSSGRLRLRWRSDTRRRAVCGSYRCRRRRVAQECTEFRRGGSGAGTQPSGRRAIEDVNGGH